MDVTVVLATYNAVKAVALSWESFKFHHGNIELFAGDDGSDDGADCYIKNKANLFRQYKGVHHAAILDDLCKLVKSKYTLIIDSDVEFLRPVLGDMLNTIEINKAWCVAASSRLHGEFTQNNVMMQAQRRIDPMCALFDTKQLQKFLRWFTFGPYTDHQRRRFFDTGGMLYCVAQAAGLKTVELEELRRQVVHYGGMSTGMNDGKYLDEHQAKKYELIKKRLNALEGGSQTVGKDLEYDGSFWEFNV